MTTQDPNDIVVTASYVTPGQYELPATTVYPSMPVAVAQPVYPTVTATYPTPSGYPTPTATYPAATAPTSDFRARARWNRRFNRPNLRRSMSGLGDAEKKTLQRVALALFCCACTLGISLLVPWAVISSENLVSAAEAGSQGLNGGLVEQPKPCTVAAIFHRNVISEHPAHYHHPHHPHHPHSPHGHSPSNGRRLSDPEFRAHEHRPHKHTPHRHAPSHAAHPHHLTVPEAGGMVATDRADGPAETSRAAEAVSAVEAGENAPRAHAPEKAATAASVRTTENRSAQRRLATGAWTLYPRESRECYDRWVLAFTGATMSSAIGEPLSSTRARLQAGQVRKTAKLVITTPHAAAWGDEMHAVGAVDIHTALRCILSLVVH